MIQVWNLRFNGGARRVFVRGYRDPRGSESTQSRDLPPKIDALFAVLTRRERKLKRSRTTRGRTARLLLLLLLLLLLA